jgi:hypothetical protein
MPHHAKPTGPPPTPHQLRGRILTILTNEQEGIWMAPCALGTVAGASTGETRKACLALHLMGLLRSRCDQPAQDWQFSITPEGREASVTWA